MVGMPMEWLSILRDALHEEYGWNAARVATLATVDRSDAPHARSVICRRIDDDGQLYFTSDARSDKNSQVHAEPRVELVFWLPRSRTEFRVAGEMRIVSFGQDETLRREIWREMSDESRSIFFWPTPGVAVAGDDVYPEAVSADVNPPANFEILILRPTQVERLVLSVHPHRRRRWRADASWNGVDVNP
jgi:pyridoxamine 5'-phosphate oxidase